MTDGGDIKKPLESFFKLKIENALELANFSVAKGSLMKIVSRVERGVFFLLRGVVGKGL